MGTNEDKVRVADAHGDRCTAKTRRGYSRRTILRAMLGATGGAALAACGGASNAPTSGPLLPTVAGSATATTRSAASTASPVSTTAQAATAAATVTRVASPVAGADGIIPPPAPGVPEAYLKPLPPFKSVGALPGRGSKVTTFQNVVGQPPLPKGENQYWQELEKRLGVTLDATIVPTANYAERLSALTAAGDLPDLTMVNTASAPDQARIIQQGAYTDLTPYLTGDALKDYPNLAAWPAALWKNIAIRGKIYGVPRPLLQPGEVLFFRRDWATKMGNPQPKNADEFFDVVVGFSKRDPDGNGQADTYGIGSLNNGIYGLGFFMEIFRVPNEWRRSSDGSLTYHIETEEFRQTIAYMRRLVEAGVYHPDTATMTQAQARDNFSNGKIGGFAGSVSGLSFPRTGLRVRLGQANPAGEAIGLVPFGHDGGKGVAHSGSGSNGFVAIPTKVGRDRERVKELLRIVNYYAAPHFSEERIFLDYGLPGVHHEVQPDGSQVLTNRGGQELAELFNVTFPYPTPALYYPYKPSEAVFIQDLIRDMVAINLENPCLTAYSQTAVSKGGELRQLRIDRLNAIIAGRQPLTALDDFVRDWRSRGGDEIRREYEADLKS